jgi:hypothetical protein
VFFSIFLKTSDKSVQLSKDTTVCLLSGLWNSINWQSEAEVGINATVSWSQLKAVAVFDTSNTLHTQKRLKTLKKLKTPKGNNYLSPII